jgi:hypothetical protein
VADVAREVNLAARFGQIEVALEHTADGARKSFLDRRAAWGDSVRVLDFELSDLRMPDSENATVIVDIQWTRIDEEVLNRTRVEQTWRGGLDDRGWMLVRERRIAGDLGLFGEKTPEPEARAERPDLQFATKVIR